MLCCILLHGCFNFVAPSDLQEDWEPSCVLGFIPSFAMPFLLSSVFSVFLIVCLVYVLISPQ